VSSDNMGRHAVGVLQQCHVSVGTVLQSGGTPLRFSRRVRAFLDREFPDRWTGRGRLTLWPHRYSDFIPMIFSSGGLHTTLFIVKNWRMWMSCIAEPSELQS